MKQPALSLPKDMPRCVKYFKITQMKRREILSGLTILPLAALSGTDPSQPASQREEWTPKKAVIPTSRYTTTSPLSTCVRSGHLVYVCGIGGWYPDQREI
jgi:hypothetical protein